MNLKLFDILKYIFKWKIRIIAIVIIAFFGTKFYVDSIQTYNAQIIIKFNDEAIHSGSFPDGSKFDENEIASPTVIQRTLNALGKKSTVEKLRSRITVKPIIPKAEEELKASKTKMGEEYTFYPDTFTVTFIGGVNQPAYEIRDMLDSLILNYIEYYSEKYGQYASINDALADTDVDNYDYVEITDIMSQNISSIIESLNGFQSAEGGFRSTVTGMSFGDLISQYTHIQNFNIPTLFAEIYKGKISKNKSRLIESYLQKEQEQNLENKNFTEYAQMTFDKMQTFSNANKDVPNAYNNSNTEQNNDNLQMIDGVYDYDKIRKTTKTTYDTLMENYTNQLVGANSAKLNAMHYREIADIFSNEGGTENVNIEELENKIKDLIYSTTNKMHKLYNVAYLTIDDYNQYCSRKHTTLLTGVKCYATTSPMLYELIIVVITGVGVIILAITVEIIKKYKKESVIEDGEDGADNPKEEDEDDSEEEIKQEDIVPPDNHDVEKE